MKDKSMKQLNEELKDLKIKLVKLYSEIKGSDRSRYYELEREIEMTEFLIHNKEKEIQYKTGELIMKSTRF